MATPARMDASDSSAISLEIDCSDIEMSSPSMDELGGGSPWVSSSAQRDGLGLRSAGGRGELQRITSKHREGLKALQSTRRYKLVEELVMTERNFVQQLCKCADGAKLPSMCPLKLASNWHQNGLKLA